MVHLGRVVRSVHRHRKELQQLASKRWYALDKLALRALGMFLGAFFVSILINFKSDDMSYSDYYLYTMLGALAICPAALLCITRYRPPASVTIASGTDTLEFRLIHNARVSFYQDRKLVIGDVQSIEIDREAKQMVLQEDAPPCECEARGPPPVTVGLDCTPWPKTDLGHVLAMIDLVNEGEFASCIVDVQRLTAQVIAQILSWTIKDFFANGMGHTWGESPLLDLLFSVVLFVIFFVLTLLTKLFRLEPYKSFAHAPFLGPQGLSEFSTDVKRVLSTYVLVILGALPLSVGWGFNEVVSELHLRVLDASGTQYTDASRSDYHGSALSFSYAVYFLAVAVVTVVLKVYSKRIAVLVFHSSLVRQLVRVINDRCCCLRFQDLPDPPAVAERADAEAPAAKAPAREDGERSGAAEGEEASKAPPREGGGRGGAAQGGEEPSGRQPPQPRADAGALPPAESPAEAAEEAAAVGQLVELISALERKVRSLERATGLRGSPPREEDDDDLPKLPLLKHWKAVTVSTADETSMKTLQFLYAWAALYLIEHIFFIYLAECNRTSSDPWSRDCTYHNSLALALFLSSISWVYLYTIAGLSEQSRFHEAMFALQTQAIPLAVGWTWKGFADDVLDKLKAEWGSSPLTWVYIVLFITMYIFGSLLFHIYSVVSRERRPVNDVL